MNVCNNKAVSWLPDSPSPALPPDLYRCRYSILCINLGRRPPRLRVLFIHLPRSCPRSQNRTHGTSPRRRSTGPFVRFKRHRPLPPGLNKHQRRCDKNRDMDNRGPALASTSHPRFELPVPVLAIHPHHISSPLLPLPAASITTSSGPNKSSCLSSSACSVPRHLAQGAPRTQLQLNSFCAQYKHRALPRALCCPRPPGVGDLALFLLSATLCHALLCNLVCGVAGGLLHRYVLPSNWVLSISVIYWRRAR